MFKYGNPLILEGSGRIKTDPLNEKRIEQVLSRFEEWAHNKGGLKHFEYAINAAEQKRSLVAFPAAGFAVLCDRRSSEPFLRWPSCTLTRNTSVSASRCSRPGWATRSTSSTSSPTTSHVVSAISGTTLRTSAACSTTTTLATPIAGFSPNTSISPLNNLSSDHRL